MVLDSFYWITHVAMSMKFRHPIVFLITLFCMPVWLNAQRTLYEYFPGENFIDNSSNFVWGIHNQNVNHRDGTDWQDVKRATAIIQAGIGFCSCTLMNNAKQDGRLLISTAAHCIRNNVGAEIGLVLSFNYEMSDALDRGTREADVAITKAYDLLGTVRMKDDEHDIAIIELQSDGLDEWAFNSYVSGYNASTENIVKANISHPRQDHKKIFLNPMHQTLSWKRIGNESGNINTGYFYGADDGWNNLQISPLKGSSGSGFYNPQQELIGVVSKGGLEPPSFATAISNSLYIEGQEDLLTLLDPQQTWITKAPGGYLQDLIPTTADFTLDINPGETFSTPGINSEDPTQLDGKVLYLRPTIVFDDLINMFNAPKGIEGWERILGIKLPNPNDSKVILTLYALRRRKSDNHYEPSLLYGSFANNTSLIKQPIALGFREEGWDCEDPPEGFPSCDRGENSHFNNLQENSSTNIKGSIVGQLIKRFVITNRIQYLKDAIPIMVQLTNVGTESVQVQAVSYPGEVPRNALELFSPEEFTGHFQSRKYRENRGTNSDALHIENLTVSQGAYAKTIQTGDNGGYLNLVNPNFKIGPIQTMEAGNSVTFTGNVHNTTTQPFTYKAWIDYFNTTDLNGVETDHTYNFVLDPVPHASERLAVQQNVSGNQFAFTVDIPTAQELSLEPGQSRLTRLRVELSNKNDEIPELIDVQNIPGESHTGETEDYLIEIKASSCEDLRPSDYVTYAEGVLPYCGEDGYRATKEPLTDHYQETTTGGVFRTGKQSNVRYASAKATSSWYTNGANALIDNRVTPIPNPADPSFDQSLMAISTNAQESDPNELVDQDLKMDIYYPLPKDGTGLDELPALPVIIYHFGGAFMWNTRQSKLTQKTCEWLASRGYIVAAIDYRVGLYGYEEEVAKRTLIRAWQDSRAATKWWRMSQNEYQVTEEFQVLWKADQAKVFALGHSAGGITSQANLYLTEAIFGDEIVSGDFLAGAIDGYGYGGIDDSGNPHYRTFSLEDYAPIPCLEIMGVNLCDELSKNTDGTYGSYQGDDPQVEALVTQLFQEYTTKEGRVNEAISFAGALAKTDWMFTAPFRPSSEIHHQDDAVVPWGYDFPFNGGSLPWGSIANLFPEFSLSRVYGGGAMKAAWDEAANRGIFELLTLAGTDQAGLSGQASYHIPQYQFGSSYDDYLAGGDPEIEDKIMYYVDAFFTKDWGGTSGARVSHEVEENSEPGANEPDPEALFKVFPNPASEEVNVIVDLPNAGPVSIEMVDMQGRVVYQKQNLQAGKGTQWIRLGRLDLASGVYALKVRSVDYSMQERVVIKR